MPDEVPHGCVEPVEGPILPEQEAGQDKDSDKQGEATMHVTVGQEAPDFVATAYHEGGFKNIKLSDYRGSWVLLCFYPGDFTFV